MGEAMRALSCRAILSWLLILLLPASMFAADASAAMLYTNGTTWINGGNVPKSSVVFSGDLVQTKSDSVASIKSPGSSVLVLSDSLVQFEGGSLKLEHGSVNIGTSKNMATQVGGLRVEPAAGTSWTVFEVHDTDGAVRIIARKGDLRLTDADGSVTLPQGQETTRDESSQKRKRKRERGGAVPAAGGGILDSPWAIGAGAAAVGGLTAWVLIRDDEPASPSSPTGN
jgi:hypothetical protein